MYKIMIVEDDRTIAGVLERQLERWGCSVYTVQDFGAVLEEFR